MPKELEFTIDIYLVNSKVNEISEPRRMLGVLFLWLARWLLKSELRIEEAE